MTQPEPLSRTSTSLLGRVADGDDQSSAREFVARYGPMVRRLAFAAGLSEADAEDVYQEVLAGVIQALREQRYDRERGRFKAFLKGVIFHKISDSREPAAPSRSPTALRNLPDPRPSPAETFEMAFEKEYKQVLLQEALDEIRSEVAPVTFQAFDLVSRKGHKAGAVAKLLGISRNAVYLAKSHVLERLREKLGESVAGPL